MSILKLDLIKMYLRHYSKYIILIIISASCLSCSNSVKLIESSRIKFGEIKFYSETTSKNNPSIKRIYASVKSDNNQSFYSFYPYKMVKTTDTSKNLIYTAFYGHLNSDFHKDIYQEFSNLDSIVLIKFDNLLDTFRLHNFKIPKDIHGFQIEINYYHGSPKHKRLRP